MAGDQDDEVSACREVSPARDAFVAGHNLYEHPVEVFATGTKGTQVGEKNMQVNIFPGREPAGKSVEPAGSMAGRLLSEVTDPFMLEVHRPVQPDKPTPDLPDLPAYLSRDLDRELAGVVRAASEDTSGIAVLVGGSSTGKTRACWEALRLLRDQQEPWRLWHPIDPTRPEAALRELPRICPWTVIWLNEAQFYLDVTDGGLGEKVAAGLRELLRDPARAPVLVLATLWPEFWERLAVRPTGTGTDPHAQARELLAGRDIPVPGSLTAVQVRQLSTAQDPRLAQAAAAAEKGQVVQYLAGTPELMAHYHNAPSAAKALMNAAIDARRLGMSIALPLDFLEEAAPAYLSDAGWEELRKEKDWTDRALDYTSAPCKGVRGPLARTRPGSGQAPEPAYRLADYLDQHGRATRRVCIPPQGFWDAAARHARPGDLPALAEAAEKRGLLRDSARIRKRAVACGDTVQAALLVRRWHSLAPYSDDSAPDRWAAVHARLGDPGSVARLLNALTETGVRNQAAALIARGPAAHADLGDPGGVAGLLSALAKVGALDQVAVLAERAVAHVRLDDGRGAVRLLSTLAKVGTRDQVAALLERAVVHVRLEDPRGVSSLLNALARVGACDQVAALIARAPAAHVDVDNVRGVVGLLDALAKAGARGQVAVLAERAAAQADLDNSGGVAYLLRALAKVGALDQVAVLAERAVAHVRLDNPGSVAGLLRALARAGARDQVTIMVERGVAQARLENPGGVAGLLRVLAKVRARDQITALIARGPAAHADLENPGGVAGLLSALAKAGALDQVAVLAERAVAGVRLGDSGGVSSLLNALARVGACDQVAALIARAPAAHVDVDNVRGVVGLLDALAKAGALDQVAEVVERAAVGTRLGDSGAAVQLLDALTKAGFRNQARTLVGRLPGEGLFSLYLKQADHRVQYRLGREPDGAPSHAWGWQDLA